jgi:hypothetical protein
VLIAPNRALHLMAAAISVFRIERLFSRPADERADEQEGAVDDISLPGLRAEREMLVVVLAINFSHVVVKKSALDL